VGAVEPSLDVAPFDDQAHRWWLAYALRMPDDDEKLAAALRTLVSFLADEPLTARIARRRAGSVRSGDQPARMGCRPPASRTAEALSPK
jgi:hypothetical protein